jgi:hypothetical protein
MQDNVLKKITFLFNLQIERFMWITTKQKSVDIKKYIIYKRNTLIIKKKMFKFFLLIQKYKPKNLFFNF